MTRSVDPAEVTIIGHDAEGHRRELALAIRAAARLLHRAGNFDITADLGLAGLTPWTSLPGSPWQVGWETELAFELTGEIQWQIDVDFAASTAVRNLEVRVLVDDLVIHTACVQPRSPMVDSGDPDPAPTPVACGSLTFIAPLQALAPGGHVVDVQVQTGPDRLWTVKETSVLRWSTRQRGDVTARG